MKTKLVLEGKSKAEIVAATASALDKKELPALEPGGIAMRKSNKEIGAALGIAEDTVKMHVKNVLEVNDRTDAVTVALRRGILHL